MRRVIRLVQIQRDQRYSLLRGYFHGADDDTVDELDHERLTTFVLNAELKNCQLHLDDLLLVELDVKVIALRRATGQSQDVQVNPVLEGGDTMVLSGRPQGLALALERLSKLT